MARYQWPNQTEVVNEVDVKDLDAKMLLAEILRELKKANLLLSLIANEEVSENDY